jgi:hypothetical protein
MGARAVSVNELIDSRPRFSPRPRFSRGDRAGTDVEITKGFAGAQPIVTEGASKLADKAPVVASKQPASLATTQTTGG